MPAPRKTIAEVLAQNTTPKPHAAPNPTPTPQAWSDLLPSRASRQIRAAYQLFLEGKRYAALTIIQEALVRHPADTKLLAYRA